MSDEISSRMDDIVAAASAVSPEKYVPLLLIADASDKIGEALNDNKVKRFQIQLQASIQHGISYHGFPDEKAEKTGLRQTRNTLV